MSKTAKKTVENDQMNLEKHQFSAETGKVLQLMIHSLYTNKDIFLRELISNASDACDKLRYLALTEGGLMEGDGELAITVSSDEKTRSITIRDNGIGMNHDDMVANLGTIARSGTLEFLSGLVNGGQKDVAQIGQFGVGFYSSFMVAERVVVTSRKAGEKKAYVWESEGKGEYTIREAEGDAPRGTSITLFLQKEQAGYTDKFKLRHIIETYSDHIAFPILQETEEGTERVNDGSALWVKPKGDITPEQYKEFYHHVSHSPDEPFLTLHNRVEGTVSYTSLLFVPSLKPFDLFHPDRRSRVKLYVKRVFITDENVELVPVYLRFLRGIIDSEDLPLNISRETLQDNPMLRKIRESITGKVLTELKKKAEKDAEEYAKFWRNFGAALKEGLCEADSPREKLLECCKFYSTNGDELTSMADYVSRMKDGQEQIFYLTGDDLEAMKKNPMLEGFRDRGIEVLLLADHVDDFWVNVVTQYKDKPLKSITRANIDLDRFPSEKKEEAKEEKAETQDEHLPELIAKMKALYGSEVRDVRTTTKLKDTAACLAVDEGDIDMRMERFLVEHRQLRQRTAKILEINPGHPLVRALAQEMARDSESEQGKDAALLLLDQARIVEGEPISDAAAFAARLSRFMQKSITSA